MGELVDTKFRIFDCPICISEERAAYNRIRLDFIKLANEAAEQYETLYKQDGSIQKVVEKLGEQTHDCLVPALDYCIDILVRYNVIDIDIQAFAEHYQVFAEPCAEAFNKVYDRYAEVVMNEEDLDRYRVARREGRARWQGGGFGLAGALSGAVTASALNLVTGAGHMVFNAVGKTISSIASSFKLSKIYNDPKTCNTLTVGLRKSVFNLHFALVDCLNVLEVDPIPAAGLVSEENHRSAEAIVANIERLPTEDDRKEALLHVFDLDSYSPQWYIYILQHYGDKDGQLSGLANYFGLYAFDEEKKSLLSKFAASLMFDTEQRALDAQEKVTAYRKKLSYFEPLPETQVIAKAVQRFDEQYRTVNGVLCRSREEADEARKEYNAIQGIMNTAKDDDLSSLERAKEELSQYHTRVATEYQKSIDTRLQKAELTARTVDTRLEGIPEIVCDTVEEAKAVRGHANILYARLTQCGEGPEAETALLDLKDRICKVGYPAPLQDAYLKEIGRRLDEIDLTYRTAFGMEYPTRERAAAAKKKYELLSRQVASPDAKKNAEMLRKVIDNAELPDDMKASLQATLFQHENAKELKTAKKLSSVSAVLLLAILGLTIAFGLKYTPALAAKDVPLFGYNLVMPAEEVSDHLGYIDGLRNGALVFGHAVVEIFVGAFYDYVDGFSYGFIGNIIWAFLGIVWELVKYMFLAIARYFVTIVLAFFQRATLGYYVGYIISAAIPFTISKFNFDEETPEENVARIKEMKPKKIAKWVLIVLLAIAISIVFILAEAG